MTSRIKILCIGVYFFATLGFTHAAQWKIVSKHETEDIYIDYSKTKRDKTIVRSTFLVDYKAIQKIDGIDAWSSLIDSEWDCVEKKVLIHSATVFREKMASGKGVTQNAPYEWRQANRMPLEAMTKAACSSP